MGLFWFVGIDSSFDICNTFTTYTTVHNPWTNYEEHSATNSIVVSVGGFLNFGELYKRKQRHHADMFFFYPNQCLKRSTWIIHTTQQKNQKQENPSLRSKYFTTWFQLHMTCHPWCFRIDVSFHHFIQCDTYHVSLRNLHISAYIITTCKWYSAWKSQPRFQQSDTLMLLMHEISQQPHQNQWDLNALLENTGTNYREPSATKRIGTISSQLVRIHE